MISHGVLPVFLNLPNSYFFVTSQKLCSNLESLHFPTFSAKHHQSKVGREMVMENQEMVMEKSLKNILSSLWEP